MVESTLLQKKEVEQKDFIAVVRAFFMFLHGSKHFTFPLAEMQE